MAVASLSPVKILSDLGYEMVDIESDKDYLSALMEAVNTLTMTNASDLRLPVLQDEVRRVRANRKAADPTFKTRKVSVDKLMGRKTSSAQRIEPQKLLPATSEGESANTNALASRLNNISQSLDNLGNVLRQQLGIEKKSAKDQRKLAAVENKRRREEELEEEKKEGGKGESSAGKVASTLTAPFAGMFGAAQKFFGNIIAGSALLGLIKWLQTMESSGDFDNFIENLKEKAGWVLGGLVTIGGLGLVATITGIAVSIIGGLSILGGVVAALWGVLKVIAVVAASIMALRWIFKKGEEVITATRNWGHDQISGGEASGQQERLNAAEMEKVGVAERGAGLSTNFNKFKVKKAIPGPFGRNQTIWKHAEYDDLNDQQKAAVDKMRADRKRMNALEKEREQKLKELRKTLWEGPEGGTWKYTEGFARLPWNKRLTEEGKEKEKEINEKARGIYKSTESKILSGGSITPPANMGDKNVSSPNINQPLQGDSSSNLINLSGGNGAGGGGGSASGGSGSETPSFSSTSGRLGNEITIGAGNN